MLRVAASAGLAQRIVAFDIGLRFGGERQSLRLDHRLYRVMEDLKKQCFEEASFWNGERPSFFRYARIITDPEDSFRWQDADGNHPLSSTTRPKNASRVLRIIRNALAHGNAVYLDRNGQETPGNKLVYLAFITKPDRRTSRTVMATALPSSTRRVCLPS